MVSTAAGGLTVFVALVFWFAFSGGLVVSTLGIQEFRARHLQAAPPPGMTYSRLRAISEQRRNAAEASFAKEKELQDLQERLSDEREELIEREGEAARLERLFKESGSNKPSEALVAATSLRDQSSTMIEILLVQIEVVEIELKKRSRILEQIENGLTPETVTAIETMERRDQQLDVIKAIEGLRWLFIMPQEFLTLILTLAMGMFGSTIHVSRVFFGASGVPRHDSRAWFVVRPVQGAFMAFAVYILFKAGIVVLTSTGAEDTAAAGLNPYFIGFMGIISGLFSEYAYTRLDKAARKFFLGEGDGDTPLPA